MRVRPNYTFFPLFLSVLFTTHFSVASHVAASDLGFRSLGNNQYQVILKLYRDCRGDSFPADNNLLGCYVGNNGNVSSQITNLNLTRIAIKDVTPKCSNSNAPCAPNQTGSGLGIEEHTFICTLDLSSQPFVSSGLGSTYCELTVAYNQCCRNTAITTGSAG